MVQFKKTSEIGHRTDTSYNTRRLKLKNIYILSDTFLPNTACYRQIPARQVEILQKMSKISSDISAHLYRITCNKVSGILIHKQLNCRCQDLDLTHLPSHLCPPGGFLLHLVSFYPTWRILPQS